MALLSDAVDRVVVKVRATPVPADVKGKQDKSRARLRAIAPANNECLEFWRNNQYVYQSSTGTLAQLSTVPVRNDGTGHRIRQSRNQIMPIVRREVSAATQRVPSYDVVPSTMDPQDVAAAKTAEKVALYGYDAWTVGDATERVVTYAVVTKTGEGFAWPYYDEDRQTICIRVYGPNEVGWEPGVQFDDSRYLYIEQAVSMDEVKSWPGFDGLPLTPDAEKSDLAGAQKNRQAEQNLVLVRHHLERPSKRYPDGRWLTVANDRVILPEEPFPVRDSRGQAVDEPALLKLSYIVDPESDRDLGLGGFLLDPQRSYNHANNKQQEWITLSQNCQVVVKNGKLKQRLTDAPGAVYEFVGQGDVSWRPVPPVPPDLENMKEAALADMQRTASQNDIPAGLDSGEALQTFIENDQNVRQSFLARMARFHAKLMSRCLVLVQLHFDTPRLLQINGEWGPDPIEDFLGAQLKDQQDVRVSTASITPQTREGMAQRINQYMMQGWIDPQKGMAAIENGTPELILDDYARDRASAHRVIQMLMSDPETFLGDPLTTPAPGGMGMTAAWMPRPFDNLAVIEHEFTNWMKSDQYWRAGPVVQEAANLYYQGIQMLKAQEQAQAVAAQAAQAEQLGMQNATKPAAPKTLPSQPKMSGR